MSTEQWVEFIRSQPTIVNGIPFDAGLPKNWTTDKETELIFESCDHPDNRLLNSVHDMWTEFKGRVWTGTLRIDDDDYDRLAVIVTLSGIPQEDNWNKVTELIEETAKIVRTTFN